jgi:hypothetical protein
MIRASLIDPPLINGLLIRPSLIHPFQIHQDIPVTLNSYHV